jgi:hypothetical protein
VNVHAVAEVEADRLQDRNAEGTVNTSAAPSTGGIHQVVQIDASPIGQNTRSTPATYSWAFDQIAACSPSRRTLGAGAGRPGTSRSTPAEATIIVIDHDLDLLPPPTTSSTWARWRPGRRAFPRGGASGDVARDAGSVTGPWLAEHLVSGHSPRPVDRAP